VGAPVPGGAAQQRREVTYFWGSTPGLTSPDVQTCVAETPIASRENGSRYGMPEYGWSLIAGVVAPKSRGHIELTGPDPDDAVCIEANMLSEPEDLRTAVAAVELSREIGDPDAGIAHLTVPGILEPRRFRCFASASCSSRCCPGPVAVDAG
jgi:choline dehydrogenase